MALTLHKCPRCGQRYYDGTPHRCPPRPAPQVSATPQPAPIHDSSTDSVYAAMAVILMIVGLIMLAPTASNPAAGLPPEIIAVGLSAWAFSALIGGLIGSIHGRVAYGVFWGMLAGPLGWLLALLVEDRRRRCPWCRLVVPEGAMVCGHCTRALPPG